MMRTCLLAAVLVLTACASAPSPAIVDTSFREADGSRAIQLSGWLPASPEEVYRAVATVEGWKTWAVPNAFGEAKLGGVMETSYNAAAKAGDPGNIKQQFLALIPNRLAVFRTIQTPPGFPNAELYMRTVSIMELAPEASGTRLTFTHSGFSSEPGFNQLYDFFLKGDVQTLEQLRKRFESGPIDFTASSG